ncbi:PH and SEC7 domain-containing protein 2-like protein [Dinothrombium tinctorium]|uniref:PH and SEC7 domain-containing protein 2-like protein n=1 Tax=Dinothrombium tinctorium TaxID=1965070 RepID=A0A3S3NU57_9ACAR|nr:PH and SEC7 domain-containing protein 2-like protein [Dinothrombium tinctorium]
MADRESARVLANKLFRLEGFARENVTCFLGKAGRYWQLVAEEYLKNFDFSEQALDAALRLVLVRIGNIEGVEGAKLILKRFSMRYRQCNRTFTSAVVVYKLALKLVLLSRNLHEEVSISRKA